MILAQLSQAKFIDSLIGFRSVMNPVITVLHFPRSVTVLNQIRIAVQIMVGSLPAQRRPDLFVELNDVAFVLFSSTTSERRYLKLIKRVDRHVVQSAALLLQLSSNPLHIGYIFVRFSQIIYAVIKNDRRTLPC